MSPPRNRIDFQWKPHNSIDMAAIERMRENFPKPTKQPPVAWFMGSIDYYNEIDAVNWDNSVLENYLFDTGGGIRNFGRLRIWVEWFLYLLPDLILRSTQDEDSGLYETIITYWLNVYQLEIYDEYLGFYTDIFQTLMQVLMQSRFWQDDDIFAPCWTDPIEELQPETDGRALEATMIFCIKYLTPHDMSLWVQSIAEISGKNWRKKIKSWLERFTKMLKFIDNPHLYHKNVRQPVEVISHFNFNNLSWHNDYLCVRKEDTLFHLLPEKHIGAFLDETSKYPFFGL